MHKIMFIEYSELYSVTIIIYDVHDFLRLEENNSLNLSHYIFLIVFLYFKTNAMSLKIKCQL